MSQVDPRTPRLLKGPPLQNILVKYGYLATVTENQMHNHSKLRIRL